VESTSRHAWELGYDVVLPQDLTTTFAAELHDLSVKHVFPRIARVTTTDQIAFE
jgi:nicotinamidase-related amidase